VELASKDQLEQTARVEVRSGQRPGVRAIAGLVYGEHQEQQSGKGKKQDEYQEKK